MIGKTLTPKEAEQILSNDPYIVTFETCNGIKDTDKMIAREEVFQKLNDPNVSIRMGEDRYMAIVIDDGHKQVHIETNIDKVNMFYPV